MVVILPKLIMTRLISDICVTETIGFLVNATLYVLVAVFGALAESPLTDNPFPPWLYTKGDIEPSNCFVLCTSNSYRTIVNIPIYRYVPPIRRFIHADNCTRNAVIGDWKRCNCLTRVTKLATAVGTGSNTYCSPLAHATPKAI